MYVMVQYTPISKTVWRVQVILPNKTDWETLEAEYIEYLNILKSKYGQPTAEATEFLNPYQKGDGNEMTAVELEKCIYTSVWTSKQGGVMISISKIKRVIISYENSKNLALEKEEKKELNKQIF